MRKIISILIFILLVIIVIFFLSRNYVKEELRQRNSTPLGFFLKIDLKIDDKKEILQQLFPKSSIEIYKKEKKEYYKIIGDSKTEFNVKDGTPVREKEVTLEILPIDINRDGKEEVATFVSIAFTGAVAEGSRNRFYIAVFKRENNQYKLLTEQEVNKPEELEIFYDLLIEKFEAIDLNNDGIHELMTIYKADAYLGLNAEKVIIFEWRMDKFYPIWRETLHLDTSRYSRRRDGAKIYDADFQFIPSGNSYPKIKVKKVISKENDIIFSSPKIEIKEYIWNNKERKFNEK